LCGVKGSCVPASECTGRITSDSCGESGYVCCEPGCKFDSWKAQFPYAEKIADFFRNHEKIYDDKAIATILGNLERESQINPLLCESCECKVEHTDECLPERGNGIGLVQWTDPVDEPGPGRRTELFNYCAANNLNCDEVDAQLAFAIQEGDWKYGITIGGVYYKSPKACFQERGKEIGEGTDHASYNRGGTGYMECAARWIRWGDLGDRIESAQRWLSSC
jgi:hypothetical protein